MHAAPWALKAERTENVQQRKRAGEWVGGEGAAGQDPQGLPGRPHLEPRHLLHCFLDPPTLRR